MAVRVVPISETRAKLADLIKEANESGEPYFITQRSQATAVLLGIDQYNALLRHIEALERRAPQESNRPAGAPANSGHELGELLSRYARSADKALA